MKAWTYLRARAEQRRNDRRTPAEIEARRIAKFRRLVAHAAANSSYYREIIARNRIDIGACRPEDFPPLTKTEAMANFDKIVTDRRVRKADVDQFIMRSTDPLELLHNRYTVIHTSGSSGVIGVFVFDPDDWARGAAKAGRLWSKGTLHRRRFAYFGASKGHTGGVTNGAAPQRFWARLRFNAILCNSEQPIAKSVEELNRFRPDILTSVPSYLMLLVEQQERGALKIAPSVVMTGGEVVTDEHWERLEAAFGCEVFDVYGTSEHSTMGIKRRGYGGTYLLEDDLIFELEEKRTLVTNLFNFTFPLIRYVMDDVMVPLEDPDPLLPFTKVRLSAGRPEKHATFTNANGEDVLVSALEQFFVPDLRRHQLRVIDKTTCVFRFVLDPDLSDERRQAAYAAIERRLTEKFETYGLLNVERRIEEVENFGGGKFHMMVTPEMQAVERLGTQGP